MRDDAEKERLAAAVGILALLAVMLAGIIKADHYPAVTAVLGIGLTAAPLLARRYACLPLPWALTAMTAMVTFLHSFGIIVRAYDLMWWWDILTHVMATSVMAVAANLVIVVVGRRNPPLEVPMRQVPLVALGLIIVLGMVWEVAEFAADGAGMITQYSLNDTAVDLSVDILGGVFVTILIPPFLARLDDNYGICEVSSPFRP